MAENRIIFGHPPVLTIDIKRRLFPDGHNYTDRNMLAVNVTVVAGRFRGFLETQLRTDELARLRETLREMYKQLRGEWHQEFMRSGLDLRIKGDGLGRFHLACIANDQPGTGNELAFSIDFDQTKIPEMVGMLHDALASFPIRPD